MTESATSEEFLALIDDKLAQILEHPAGWGGASAVEPVVLVLLMLRNKVVDPTSSDRDVVKAYREFLAQRLAPGPGALATRLGTDASPSELAEVLREHVECAQAKRIVPTEPPDVPKRPDRGEQPAAEPHYLHRQAS